MKESKANKFKSKGMGAILLLALTIGWFGIPLPVLGHGGEDHGDEKPKTATTAKGTISRTSRLGGLEIMLKHPLLEPDTGTVARFFITKFETNEPEEKIVPAIEIESANGSITAAEIEKTETAGSFIVRIPALPEGVYTVRAKLTYGGETDTATFSGVEVAASNTETAVVVTAWLGTALVLFAAAIVVGLFGVLFYFAFRMAGKKQIREEVVST